MRLRHAEPELWLALSSGNAPEHPCAGSPPSVRAALAMQSLGTISAGARVR